MIKIQKFLNVIYYLGLTLCESSSFLVKFVYELEALKDSEARSIIIHLSMNFLVCQPATPSLSKFCIQETMRTPSVCNIAPMPLHSTTDLYYCSLPLHCAVAVHLTPFTSTLTATFTFTCTQIFKFI